MLFPSLVPLGLRYVWYRARTTNILPNMAKRRQNLKENIDAGKVRLSPEDVQAVREVADKADAAQGNRYPDAYMSTLFAETPLP